MGRLLPGKLVEVTAADGAVSLLTGTNVMLASGSVPRTLPGFEVDGRYVQTSDELLSLRELPRSAAVIGGGAIGCEFASMLADLGVRVTVLEALPKILPGCDQDVVNVIVRSFAKRGITVRTGVVVTGHEPEGDHTAVVLGDGDKLEVETILMSIGRRPLSDALLAEDTGVEIDERGYVRVDEWMRTGAAGVFAESGQRWKARTEGRASRGGASSSTTWALVPPTPNASTRRLGRDTETPVPW